MLNLILYSTYIRILSRNVLFLIILEYLTSKEVKYSNDSIQGLVSCFDSFSAYLLCLWLPNYASSIHPNLYPNPYSPLQDRKRRG